MKLKLLLSSLIFICGIEVYAQNTTFGLTAGYLAVNGKITADGLEIKRDQDGLYVGGLVDISLSENFHLQPELSYATYDDYGLLMLPILAKFYPVPKLNLQVGPQFDYSTKEYPIEQLMAFAEQANIDISEDDFTRLGISLAAGLGFDITEHIFAQGRYTFQFNDVYQGDLDISVKGHILNLGLGYRF